MGPHKYILITTGGGDSRRPCGIHRYLAALVFVDANKKVYMPAKKAIWQRYLRKFSKQGKLLESALGLEIDAIPLEPDSVPEA